MTTAYINTNPNKKNFIIVTTLSDGRAEIAHDAMTDEEIEGAGLDFWDVNAVLSMKSGESRVLDTGQVITRIS